MQVSEHDFDQLLQAHQAQVREIARLNAQAMHLRAKLIQRDTALAWAKEDRAELEQSIPGLPRRVNLAREVGMLQARIHDLLRERPQGKRTPARALESSMAAAENLEASLEAADLVICQAGCMSHGAYWRVQDHCKRTGKACVLVEKPDALNIVRITAEQAVC
jgi:chromosome segregation ATPase